MSALSAERSMSGGSAQSEGRFVPALKCVLTHWYQLRPSGTPIGSENNRRLIAINSMHRLGRRQGLDAVRGAIIGSIKGERILEAVLLPIGAALFPEVLPVEFILQLLRTA